VPNCLNYFQLTSSYTGNFFHDLSGFKEPLMVKFADGGNKKKMPYAALQWLGREQEVSQFAFFIFDLLKSSVEIFTRKPNTDNKTRSLVMSNCNEFIVCYWVSSLVSEHRRFNENATR
jgi:hypothetical protein